MFTYIVLYNTKSIVIIHGHVVLLILFSLLNVLEILGSYNDDDIYLFDNEHSDGADCIKSYEGHRNNATGQINRTISYVCLLTFLNTIILSSHSFSFSYISVKGVNFFGPHSEFIVSGSDDSYIFIWDKQTEKVINFVSGDDGGVVSTYTMIKELYFIT